MASDDFDPSPWLDDISSLYQQADPAHDFSHIIRACKIAWKIGQKEKADMKVLLPPLCFMTWNLKKERIGARVVRPGRPERSPLLPALQGTGRG